MPPMELLKYVVDSNRLRTLYDYKILDTPAAINYDEIALLAATICASPFASIGFLDKDRLWFKSAIGLPFNEVSLKNAFSLHFFNEISRVLIIDDTLKDKRFQNNQLVTEYPFIRSFMSVPLVASNDHIIGCLTIMDTSPRSFTMEQRVSLQTLANQIMAQVELYKLNSDQKDLMFQITKLSELGTYAATIAHEINTPLATMSSKVALLDYKIKEGEVNLEVLKKFCESFEKNILRVSKIIKGLTNIGRDGRNDPFSPVNIKSIIDDTVELCHKRLSNNNVKLETSVPGHDVILDCRASQIGQVLLNLINNAFDAIDGLPDKWVKLAVIDHENDVEINVIDSGNGIPTEIRDKMFSNFFTTKAVGKGTGIGLSVSTEIINLHNGRLSVDAKDKNTKFVIMLPKKQVVTAAARAA